MKNDNVEKEILNLIAMVRESTTPQHAQKLIEKLSWLYIETAGKIDEFICTNVLDRIAAIGDASIIPYLEEFVATAKNSNLPDTVLSNLRMDIGLVTAVCIYRQRSTK
ncbi:hypothetical protein KJ841_00180 [Patescibacteria group bacterium]|nr:hypothetical protein [Patescibacteria group bacterium]